MKYRSISRKNESLTPLLVGSAIIRAHSTINKKEEPYQILIKENFRWGNKDNYLESLIFFQPNSL